MFGVELVVVLVVEEVTKGLDNQPLEGFPNARVGGLWDLLLNEGEETIEGFELFCFRLSVDDATDERIRELREPFDAVLDSRSVDPGVVQEVIIIVDVRELGPVVVTFDVHELEHGLDDSLVVLHQVDHALCCLLRDKSVSRQRLDERLSTRIKYPLST